jgi:aspartyl-tRNA(Asn)/glutamyl-tRNA(Gln) amidotransferase subunit C
MISARKIKEISRLAHIHLEPEEAAHLEKDLEKVFAWVESIEKVSVQCDDVSNKEPSILRQDVITEGNIADKIVGNAPQTHAHYFSVPKVIES